MNDSNTKLQDFVTSAAARGQITFGDVRRLERDYLPGGITTGEEAEMLISLDRIVIRADRAWKGWLVAAIRNFKARADQPINQEIDRQVEHAAAPVRPVLTPRTIPFPIKRDYAPPVPRADILPRMVLTVVTWSSMNRLAMAA
jgi:hypothetical protein